MALVNLIGFDHFKTVPTYNAGTGGALFAAASSLASGLAGLPGNDTTTFGSMLSSYSSTWLVNEVTLSNGKVRKFLCTSGASSYMRWQMNNAQVDALPKTGKWYLGARIYYAIGPQAGSPGTGIQIRLGSNGLIVSAVTYTPGVSYMEVEIDWVALTIKTYLNGVLQNTVSGAAYLTPSYTGKLINVGPTSSYSGTGPQAGFTDFYFIVEEANEPNPIGGRLGPIIVKPLPRQSIANAGRFTPPGTLSVLDQFNANNTDLGVVPASGQQSNWDNRYYNVQTSPNGEIATLSAALPTETQPIVAVQVATLSHKLQAAAAGTQQQLKQGTASLPLDRTIPGLVGAPTRKTYAAMKAPDGGAWSNEKVGQIKLDIGSYRP